MELALLRAGLRAGLKRAALLTHNRSRASTPSTRPAKMMATVHRRGDNYLFAVKGAPEAVLAAASRTVDEDGEAPLDPRRAREWGSRVEHLGHHGLRVMACAMKTAGQADAPPYET